MEEQEDNFQGVICCCLNSDRSVKNIFHNLLDFKDSPNERPINCFNLELKNKYYQTTIQLIDFVDLSLKDEIQRLDILNDCHAIILSVNDQNWTIDQLDNKINELKEVGGEPRILMYNGVDEGGLLQAWSIKNGYDLIDATDETASTQLIDSLSAYRWTYRSDETDNKTDRPKLNDELMQKLADFDTLLGKLSAYRDKPELRGKPDDKNMEEIAGLLSGLLGDDVDDFLDVGEGSNDSKSNST